MVGGYFRIREGWLPCAALVRSGNCYTKLTAFGPRRALNFWAGARNDLGPSWFYTVDTDDGANGGDQSERLHSR